MSDKKKTLLALKEKLLQDIQYCEDKIVEARDGLKKSSFEDLSSDSEEEFTLEIDTGPTIPELRKQQDALRTSLLATQELSGIEVLQSEVNVLIEEPDLDGEPPVLGRGVWREVLAEARADLVPFCISYYVHTNEAMFGPRTYRRVCISAVKATHAHELARSVIHDTKTPSDAVGMVCSYASAWRSRRVSLARLAKTYRGVLEMEPADDGGYCVRVPPLLSLVWRLHNGWSPLAPFQHRMKFDLDYLDENYVKTISQANKELSDPTIDTDERTRLLSKIIATCLEAKGQNDTLESSENEAKRNIEEEELPAVKKHKKDSEIMAPPKHVPKKVVNKKSKVDKDVTSDKKDGEEDSVACNKQVRDVEAKKSKVGKDKADKNVTSDKKDGEEDSVASNKQVRDVEAKKSKVGKDSVANSKNVGKDVEVGVASKQTRDVEANNASKESDKREKTEGKTKDSKSVKNVHEIQDVNKNTERSSVATKENKSAGRNGKENIPNTRTSSVATQKNKVKDKLPEKIKSTGVANGKIVKKVIKSKVINKSTEKMIKNIKKLASEGDAQVELLKKVANTKIGVPKSKIATNVASVNKPTNTASAKPKITDKVTANKPINKPSTGTSKQLKVNGNLKENNSRNSEESSKIPKKIIPSVTDLVSKNALRSSPRTNQHKSKLPGVQKSVGGKAKIVKPIITNIPRPVSKPKAI